MLLENDCSATTLVALQEYFSEKGFIITSLTQYEGLDNKEFGDAKYNLVSVDGTTKSLNIDFKKHEKNQPFINIELVYVKANGGFDGWLFNDNEDLIVYETFDKGIYVFTHNQLISIAKKFNTQEVWNTSIIYNKNPNSYQREREFIDKKLSGYRIIKSDKPEIEGKISGSDIHIKGTFNYTYHGKVHSGFCLCIPLEYASNFKINTN